MIVLINGVSFHSEESVHKWKYVVQCRIANELNFSNKHQSCTPLIELIQKAGLMKIVSEVGPFYPCMIRELIVNLSAEFNDPSADKFHKAHVCGVCFTISPSLLNQFLGVSLLADFTRVTPSLEQLAIELTGGTVHSWPSGDQLLAALLSVKHAILHKIGIANSLIHASTISTSLAQLIYLIGTSLPIDVGDFLFKHLMRHVDTFGINNRIFFPICFVHFCFLNAIIFFMLLTLLARSLR